MQMKIAADEIRRQREARLWSQEHLAELAGISLRTVQRVETEGNASNETAMALAAAFDLPIAALRPGGTPALNEARPAPAAGANPPATSTPPASPAAPRQARFHTHLLIYLAVCGSMLLADFSSNGSITWSKWPLLGWGIGVLLSYLKIQRRQARAAQA